MEYTRDNYLKLKSLLAKGNLSPSTQEKAQEYVRQYRLLNPQEAQTGLETSQATQGVTGAVQSEGASALEERNPEMRQVYDENVREQTPPRKPAPADYPPQFAQEASLHQGIPGAATPAQQEKQQAVQHAREFDRQTFDKIAPQLDPSLPSESGAKGLYRKPELVAQRKGLAPVEPPVYYSEPSLDEFHKEMQYQIGPGVTDLDENSTQFKIWRDARYANAYDRAKAAGIGIVRVDHARGTTWERRANKAVGALRSGASSAMSMYTAGLSGFLTPPAQRQREQLQEEGSPTAATVGGVAGTFGGAPEAIFGGVGRAINAIPGVRKLETSALGRLGVAGLKGGAGAAAIGGVEDASRAAARAIEQNDAQELVPSAETLKRAAERFAIGAPIGAMFELAGHGGERATARLRDPEVRGFKEIAPEVKRLDEAGASLRLGGVKPSPAMERQIARGKEVNATPEDVAADELIPELTTAAGKLQEGTIARAAKRTAKAIDDLENAGDPHRVPWEMVDTVLERARKGLDENGQALPLISREKEFDFLKQAIVGNPRGMPKYAAVQYVKRYPETKAYSRNDLISAGFKVGPAKSPDEMLVVTGKPIGAREAEKWLKDLKELSGGPPDSIAYMTDLSIKKPTGALRLFIAKKFPQLSEALNESHRELATMEARHAATGYPKRITSEIENKVGSPPVGVPQVARKDVPDAFREALPQFGAGTDTAEFFARRAEKALEKGTEPRVKSFKRYTLDPFTQLPKVKTTLLGKKEAKTMAGFEEIATAAKGLPAYRAFEGLLARTRVEGETMGHPYGSVNTGGARVGGMFKWSTVRTRTDSIMKALGQMPPKYRGSLVRLVKSVHQGLKDQFGPSLKELEQLVEQHAAEIERLQRPEYLAETAAAEGEAAAQRAAAKRAKREAEAAALDKTNADLGAQSSDMLPRGPAEIGAERDARVAVLLKATARLTKEQVRREAKLHPPAPRLQDPGSIRGGRPGRAAAAAGNEPEDLTPEELTLLELILQANPEKPKAKEAEKPGRVKRVLRSVFE